MSAILKVVTSEEGRRAILEATFRMVKDDPLYEWPDTGATMDLWIERNACFELLGIYLDDEAIGCFLLKPLGLGNYEAHIIVGEKYHCRWATQSIFKEFFSYVFSKCRRLTVYTFRSNSRSLALIDKLGFIYEGTLRSFSMSDDLIIHGLLKDEVKHDYL